MKKILIFISLASLCSFTIDEQKTNAPIASLPTNTVSACTATPSTSTPQTLSEQVSAFFSSPLDTQWWPARWQCGTWSAFHGWLYIVSDLTIAFSYFLIPLILSYFLYKRKERPALRIVLVLFVLFILACGLTHLMDASMFWWPAYRLGALLRFATAVISLGTAFMLIKITPKLIQFKSPEVLEEIVKERTEELRKSTLLVSAYQQALDESAIVAITDQQGMIIHVNKNFCKISKYSEEELIGKDHRIINSGYHGKEFIRDLWTDITNGKIWKGELQNKAKDGSIYWVDTTIVPFLNDKGKPYQYVAIRSDITESKKLKEQQAMLASIVNSSDDAIISKNLDGIITSWNHGAEKQFGYSLKEITGKHISIIIPPHLQNEEKEILEKFRSGSTVDYYETERIRKDRKIIQVSLSISPIKDLMGNIIGASKISRDITEKKKLEDLLDKSNRLAKIGNWEADLIKGIVYWSAMTKEIHETETNYVPNLSEGLSFYKEGKNKDRITQCVQECIEHGTPWDEELQIVTAKGNLKWIKTIGNAEFRQGKCIRFFGSFQDVDERKKVERELIKSKALLENAEAQVGLGSWELDIKTQTGKWSKQMFHLFGLEVSDRAPSFDEFMEHVHPDDRHLLENNLREIKQGIEPAVFEYRNNPELTPLRYLLPTWHLEKDADGNPVKLSGTNLDITERKKVEEKLRQSEGKFKRVFDSKMTGIIFWDENGEISDANERFLEIVGYTKNDLKEGKLKWSEMTPVEYADLDEQGIKQIQLTGVCQPFEKEYFRKDGSRVPILVGAALLDHDSSIKGVAYITDIAERKKVEQEKNSLQASLENSLNEIYVFNAETLLFSYVNKGALLNLGYSKNEIKALTPLDLKPDFTANSFKELIKPLVRNEKEKIVFFTSQKRKDSSLYAVEVHLQLVTESSPKQFLAIILDITERKKEEVEKTLLLDNTEESFILLDNNLTIVSFNNQFYYLYKMYLSRIIEKGRSILEYVQPERRETVKAIYTNVLAGKNEESELKFPSTDGSNKIFSIKYKPAKNYTNGIIGVFVTCRDITESKKAEEKLVQERALLRTLIDNIPDYIYVKDTESRHILNNKANVALLGSTTEKETIGKSLADIFGSEKASSYLENDQLVFHSGEAIINHEETITSPSSEVKYLVTTKVPLRDEANTIVGLVGISRDITWQKRAEEKIAQSEKIYRAIASSIPGSGICLIDKDQRYFLIEGDLLEKLGYSREMLLGNTIKDVLPPGAYADLLPVFERAYSGEICNRESDNGMYSTISRFVPLKDEHDKVYAVMVVVIDVTELKKAEQSIAELNVGLEQKVIERTSQLASANKELESFSYSVSHDLRAPLRAVNGYAKMLEEDYTNVLDENGKRLLRIVQENARHMGQLIDDLLTFSRLGRKEVQKAEVNMMRLTESVVAEIKILHPMADIKIDQLQSAWGDLALLKQVLFNYISNAAKYSSKSEHPLVQIKSSIVNEYIIYSVADNGTGFDMTYAHKLFQVFQRLHTQEDFEGTGVGLAIVDRIVSKHHGKVWAEAEIKKGATFYFSLPNKQLSIQLENN